MGQSLGSDFLFSFPVSSCLPDLPSDPALPSTFLSAFPIMLQVSANQHQYQAQRDENVRGQNDLDGNDREGAPEISFLQKQYEVCPQSYEAHSPVGQCCLAVHSSKNPLCIHMSV